MQKSFSVGTKTFVLDQEKAEAFADQATRDAILRAAPVAPNLIRAHRDALREASNGSLDHMVIDVIGSLFDQILSDPKVPPQMARQIARLQLPVLRAALGDPSFFSSRKHPVRRFVNRIATLSVAYDTLEAGPGKSCLEQVTALVNDIVYVPLETDLLARARRMGNRTVDGLGNSADVTQSGSDNESNILQNGSLNSATVTQSSNNNLSNISQTGNGGMVTVTQGF